MAIVGEFNTVKLAVLLGGPAAGVCVVVTPEVVFGLVPCVLLVTAKVTVQEPLAGIVMPLKLKAVAPAPSTFEDAPVQVPPAAPPTALILVSMSVKLALVRLLAFGFISVSVTVELPPGAIELGLKALLIAGAPNTVRLAVLLAAPALGVCVVVTPEVVFGCVPIVLLVTANVTVQEPLPGIVIPLKLKDVAPALSTFEDAPVQVPPAAPPTALMLVSVSVNEALLSGMEFELVSVSVTVEPPPV